MTNACSYIHILKNNGHEKRKSGTILLFQFYYKNNLNRKRMICVNSFDQKVGELHVWGSNRRFDVITLTEELRKLDGRAVVSTKIISGSFTDCATIAKIPAMDRQLKVILTTSINISITINYYYLFIRDTGSLETLRDSTNTQSFADVFGDCQKSSASKPHYWPEIKTHVCGFTFC